MLIFKRNSNKSYKLGNVYTLGCIVKIKMIKAALAGLVLAVSGIANAGLIENTENDTFIDKTTGLEWMDFGINNIHSYSQVEALLSTTYSGWALATESQVIDLWHNAFAGKSSVPDDFSTEPETYNQFTNTDATNTSFVEVFEMMGYGDNDPKASLGWFERDDGGMAYAYFYYISPTIHSAIMSGRFTFDYDLYRDSFDPDYSTMLVRSVLVPEPKALAIFALGLMGLASRRFKKQA